MPKVTGEPHQDGGTIEPGLILAPFRGVRYAPEAVPDLAAVTSPPYDLVDEEAVVRFMAAEPHNVVRLILPTESDGGRYRHAGETLRRWLAEGVLITDPSPALYVYEERQDGTDNLLQRGLIGALGLREEGSRVVLPHEDVFPGPVRDRLQLMRATEANLEPILLLYEGGGQASRLTDSIAMTEEPLLEAVTRDGVTHRLWRVTDPVRQAHVADDLRDRQALIADGHHRYATYQRLRAERHAAGYGPGPWDYGLALLVDSLAYPPQLGAIHRVIPGLPVCEAAERAKAAFQVTEVARDLPTALDALDAARAAGTAFLLGGDGRTHLLTSPDPAQVRRAMPAERPARWRELDASVLHQLLIPRIWGISENEHTVRIVHYDAAAAIAWAQRAGGTAIILNPLNVPDVLAIAADGERVPRKSTSFGPKPRTGLVLRTFAAG